MSLLGRRRNEDVTPQETRWGGANAEKNTPLDHRESKETKTKNKRENRKGQIQKRKAERKGWPLALLTSIAVISLAKAPTTVECPLMSTAKHFQSLRLKALGALGALVRGAVNPFLLCRVTIRTVRSALSIHACTTDAPFLMNSCQVELPSSISMRYGTNIRPKR